MKIKTFSDKYMAQNSFVIEKDGKVFVIDPGMNGHLIARYLMEFGKELDAVILTHAHFDHVGGTEALMKLYPKSECFMNSMDDKMLRKGGLLDSESLKLMPGLGQIPVWMGEIKYLSELIDNNPYKNLSYTPIKEGKSSICGVSVEAIFTPGHSKGNTIFKFEEHCFVGDAIFADSVGRMDIRGSSIHEAKASMNKIEMSLKDADIIYPGHGPSCFFEQIKKYNRVYNQVKEGRF